MTKEEMAEFIEKEFFITYKSVKVTYKDNKIFYGFFQNFEDHMELKKELKYRFVPNNNSVAFQADLRLKGKLNTELSIIIDCVKVAKIVLI